MEANEGFFENAMLVVAMEECEECPEGLLV
jgi:hypothetical protein